MLFKKLFAAVALLSLTAAPGLSHAAAKYTLRFAHDGAPDAVYSLTYVKFKELAEQKTGGKVKIKLFDNAVLGGDRVVTESTQRGDLEMGGCGTSNLGIFWPSAMAFDLPFVIDPAKKAALYDSLNNGRLGEYLNEHLAKVNLMALVYADCSNRHYATSKKPIKDLASLKGVKMRTTASPVDNLLAETLRMTPAPMGFAEVYTALQQGTVDGELISLSDIKTFSRGDVLRYVLPTSHSYTSMIGLISRSYWDKLPADIRAALKEAAVEACAYGRELVDQLDAQGADYAKRNDMTVYPFAPDMRKAMLDAAKPVYDKYLPGIDPAFYQLLTDTQK